VNATTNKLTMSLATLLLVTIVFPVFAEAQEDYVPLPGVFPPADVGKYIAGELVIIDPVNRRGAIRLDGGGPSGRYHTGPLHYFALLPYAVVWHNGAMAEIRDIPIGTHVHGYFLLPPKGEENTIPPPPIDQKKFEIKQNHVVTLEDDFSFYSRRGQSWKVVSVDREKEKIAVVPLGKMAKDGINSPYTFDIDIVTRVWKNRGLVDLKDVAPDSIVQFNLTWSQGWGDKEFSIADIWLDEESRNFATEMQRRRHVRYQRQRWSPGWIDSIEHFDFGGGIVTVTFFAVDPSLISEFKKEQEDGFGVACAEKTLRTWFHRADKKIGKVIEWKEIKNPGQGSSGIQVRLKFAELLDGYRPAACVRVKCLSWRFVTMPPEERVTSREEQKRGETLSLPY
jgi:hypothetical protein